MKCYISPQSYIKTLRFLNFKRSIEFGFLKVFQFFQRFARFSNSFSPLTAPLATFLNINIFASVFRCTIVLSVSLAEGYVLYPRCDETIIRIVLETSAHIKRPGNSYLLLKQKCFRIYSAANLRQTLFSTRFFIFVISIN